MNQVVDAKSQIVTTSDELTRIDRAPIGLALKGLSQ